MCLATIRFFAELNDLVGDGPTVVVDVHDTPSVKDRIEACGVPHTEVGAIVVNGESVAFDYRLSRGDHTSVYPMFRRLPVAAVALRPDLDGFRFVVDVNLGRLSRYLRLLGFDAVSNGSWHDGELATISAREDRILLTRDRQLLKRSVVVHGYLVREPSPSDQIVEVIRRFGIVDAIEPYVRCMECNGLLAPVAKDEIEDRLEPLTKKHFDVFRRCPGCDRVFWGGSHVERLDRLIEGIRKSLRSE